MDPSDFWFTGATNIWLLRIIQAIMQIFTLWGCIVTENLKELKSENLEKRANTGCAKRFMQRIKCYLTTFKVIVYPKLKKYAIIYLVSFQTMEHTEHKRRYSEECWEPNNTGAPGLPLYEQNTFFQNIFFYVRNNKDSHTGLEWHKRVNDEIIQILQSFF